MAAPPIQGLWFQLGIDIDGEAQGDQSGISVALSSDGSVVAVGARHNDGGGTNSGHVRVFVLTGFQWEQRGEDLNGEAAFDGFGSSVSLSSDGTVLAVGANVHDGPNGVNSGQVRVFMWNGRSWVARGPSISGAAGGDWFGTDVSLSKDGTVVAGGAWFGASSFGHVRIFAWNGMEWVQRGMALDGSATNDSFGYSLDMSSDASVVVCGGWGDDTRGRDAGNVRVFGWSGSSWIQIGSDLTGTNAEDRFGRSVAISGDGTVVAAGAPDGNYCRVFRFDGNTWSQVGQTLHGEAENDMFGNSIDLSEDGNTLVVGAYANNEDSGQVRVFQLVSNRIWFQSRDGIVGELSGDQFGYALAVSADASTIAIGARFNNGRGDRAGHVRVYWNIS